MKMQLIKKANDTCNLGRMEEVTKKKKRQAEADTSDYN
jgi:hypothetical protein